MSDRAALPGGARPPAPHVAGLGFLLVIVGGLVMAAWAAAGFRPDAPRSLAYGLDGRLAAEFERSLNDRLPFKQLAIRSWATLELVLFREGRPGVLIGDDGWLYSAEEFEYFPRESDELAAKLRSIVAVRDALARRQCALVVALIPAKARVERQHLGRYRYPAHADQRYERFRGELAAAGVEAPDLLAPLVAANQSAPAFCRSDTHWTPHGAAAAAQVVAAAVGALAPGLPRSTFATTAAAVEQHVGDLTTFIPVARWAARGLVVDEIQVMETTRVAGDEAPVGLFDVVVIPVALVGTSYSASRLWNFAGALQEASGLEVLNVAAEGRGPIEPMADFLVSEEYLATPPAVVVWEIPERYLPVRYDVRLPPEAVAPEGGFATATGGVIMGGETVADGRM